MVAKKTTKKSAKSKETKSKAKTKEAKVSKKLVKTKAKMPNLKNLPTLKLKSEEDIAMDFSIKAYKKFEKLIKSIILFGSSVKQDKVAGSDIDIILIVDDVSIKWDQELIAWYREELDKIMRANPYQRNIHINTIKLSTWWNDLMNGDPVIVNVLRYGQAMIDLAGFYEPLKFLLLEGKIKPTPEAIHSAIQRAPIHLQRSKASELSAIEGLYWAMVDSAQAALLAANVPTPSPEHVPEDLKVTFVDAGMLNGKYVAWFADILTLHKRIVHGEVNDLRGVVIDDWQERTEEFIRTMADLINDIISR